MKLVADANTRDGELPAAESCGLDDEDEEDEQVEHVSFQQGKGRKFFSRFAGKKVRKSVKCCKALLSQNRCPQKASG